jgi:hypothetical protein
MDFDPETAMEYAASIARPRRVGSGEDEAVADEIADHLRQFGYRVERQPFQFTTAPQTVLILQVLTGLLLVAAILLLRVGSPLAAKIAAAALLLLLALFNPITRAAQARSLGSQPDRRRYWPMGQAHATANLVATLPHENDPSWPQLYLVAHYDSKSQRLPITVRIALFMVAVAASAIVAILTLLNAITPLVDVAGLIAVIAGVPLLSLDIGNNSPGAIDNASSVGLVLHLAEMLAQRHDLRDRLQVTILIPSAEEMTLMGAVAFVTAHEQRLRRQSRNGLYILNFDGVGIDGDLYLAGRSPRRRPRDPSGLAEHVQHACRELDLPLKRFRFVGALFDHIPFAQRGFDAITLLAVGKASRSVHTPGDAVDKLHVRGFDQAGRVALRVIEQLVEG